MKEYKTSGLLAEIFEDDGIMGEIKRCLSYLFQLAELESSRKMPRLLK
jgi:hypothetical protein